MSNDAVAMILGLVFGAIAGLPAVVKYPPLKLVGLSLALLADQTS